MAKPLEEWTPEELRNELGRLADELVTRANATAPVAAALGGSAAGKGRVDVVKACENWVRGLAWDETFTREMVEEELAIIERKTGHELGPLERERVVQLWLNEYDRRYRAA
jgi:hypothetical protein